MKFDVPPIRGMRVSFHNTIKIHFKAPKISAPPLPVPASSIQYVYTENTAPEKPASKPSAYAYTITIG
jgi:hypothetical protein